MVKLIGLGGVAMGLACSFTGAPAGTESDADVTADATAQCVDPPSGVVAWWDGEVVGDDIRGDFDATNTRGNPTVETGQVGNAMRFGEDDIFEIDNAPTPSSFTIEGWMNLAQGDPNWIGLYGRFAESSLCLYENRLTYWEGNFGGGGSNGNMALSDILQTNTWYHIAFTWDGSMATSYIDGVLATAEGVPVEVALPSEVGVGGIFNGAGDLRDQFIGLLDELTLYSRALEAGEIAAIAAAGSAGKCK